MKRYAVSILLVLMFFVGLCVLLYPTVSDFVNRKTQSKALVSYERAVMELDEADFTELFAKAEEYNERIRGLSLPFVNCEQIEGYADLLDVDGSGILGYIEIDKIGVSLPIYHGTDENVLNRAAGHLEGSSLPVGGTDTHAVISAHRGLPSAKLFTDLDKLETGDTFTVTVLDALMVYRVEQILIVEPQEVGSLYIVPGEDLCTLVTCTPYGINTHRLLVRGRRADPADREPRLIVRNDAFLIDPMITAPAVAAPMLLVLFVILMIRYGGARRGVNEGGKKEEGGREKLTGTNQSVSGGSIC